MSGTRRVRAGFAAAEVLWRWLTARVERRRRRALLGAALVCGHLSTVVSSPGCGGALPERSDAPAAPRGVDELRIEGQPICIGSTVASAGRLGEQLLYRYQRLADGRLVVGYYAFFSQERPWGNNWLTWLVLPALFVDLVYTRTLLVAPGLQRALYGKGDVEGFRVVYEPAPGGLRVVEAVADDARHRERTLSHEELHLLDATRPTLYATSWSHQLAGAGARSLSDLRYRRCYGPGTIRPLSDDVAREFRVEGRARPAAALVPPAPARAHAMP